MIANFGAADSRLCIQFVGQGIGQVQLPVNPFRIKSPGTGF